MEKIKEAIKFNWLQTKEDPLFEKALLWGAISAFMTIIAIVVSSFMAIGIISKEIKEEREEEEICD